MKTTLGLCVLLVTSTGARANLYFDTITGDENSVTVTKSFSWPTPTEEFHSWQPLSEPGGAFPEGPVAGEWGNGNHIEFVFGLGPPRNFHPEEALMFFNFHITSPTWWVDRTFMNFNLGGVIGLQDRTVRTTFGGSQTATDATGQVYVYTAEAVLDLDLEADASGSANMSFSMIRTAVPEGGIGLLGSALTFAAIMTFRKRSSVIESVSR